MHLYSYHPEYREEATSALEPEMVHGSAVDESFLDELVIPLVSVPNMGIGKIKTHIGLVTGEAVAEEKNP